jgi:signal transduction histidine kinase
MVISAELRNRSLHEAGLAQDLTGADAAGHETGTLAYDFPVVITAMPINVAQHRIALGVVALLFVIGIAMVPFAGVPGAHIDAFVPVLQTVACVVDLITAGLLFSQYWIRPLRAGLAIASGYLFSGLFAFAQTLAFPGAYSAAGLIGDGLNTAAWLFIVWHAAFPIAVLTYALSKDRTEIPSEPVRSPIITIAATIVGVVAATAALTLMASSILPVHLPDLYEDAGRQTTWANAANVCLWLLNSTALGVLFWRRRTILDLWLMVTLFAWWPNFLVAIFFTVVRFSIGWYISRCLAVAASSTLLLVLLAEMTVLYARLASSILLLRRERTDRLASVEAATAAIAHEIRQPLAGIASLGSAGLKWLNRKPADIEKARSCFTSILGAAQGAEEIITSVRGLFKKVPDHRTMLQLNDVSRLVMRLARHDLLSGGITVTTDYQDDLPLIYADHTQLQQVILNLVKNAIDAMHGRPLGRRRLRLATGSDRHSIVAFYIRDSGSGVAAEDYQRIFNPFFTTKSTGMGLGLSICRTIIEEHGGTLRLTKSGPGGSTFEIALPIAAAQQAADARQSAAMGTRPAPPLVPG